MTIDLSSYGAIGAAMAVKVELPTGTLYGTNFNRPLVINGETYTGMGQVLSITESRSELKVSQTEVTVSINSIPSTNLTAFLSMPFKGAKVSIYRVVFDPQTSQVLNIANNPVGKFFGIVSNYSISENWSGTTMTCSIGLICTSYIGLLTNKTAGRRTNGTDERVWFPNDASMDRVVTISNSNLNFGAA